MRRQLKASVSRALAWTGGDRLIGAIAGHRSAPLIVGYHRVVADFASMRETSIPAMLVTARTFEQQIDWIARRYRVATLDEIGARLESGEPQSERLAAITFDDGYADVYHNAFPILRRKGIPSAVFVVTDLVGRDELQSFDRLYLLLTRALNVRGWIDWLCDVAPILAVPEASREKLRMLPRDPHRAAGMLLAALPHQALGAVLDYLERSFPVPEGCLESHRALDWEMLREMSVLGVTIGSHTRTHSLLTLEEPADVARELEGSRRLIQQRLGRLVHHFAYPDGRFSPRVVTAVRKAGYRFGYGVCAHRDAANPLLTIPRRMLWENSCLDRSGRFSAAVMSCSTNGVFDPFVRCRRGHQVSDEAFRPARAAIPAAAQPGGYARRSGAV